MRRGLQLLLGFILCVILSSYFLIPVHAQDGALLPAGQIIDSDYIRTGETIRIDGEIRGDAFLAGGLVTVNGKIDGDLFILGGKVNVNGAVGNSVRVVGADVAVNGPVGRNALLVCGNCTVTRQATIAGSLLVAGSNAEISAGKIGRGFRSFGNRLFLDSEINNEAFVVADREFLLGSNASVTGHLKYTGRQGAILEPGATVGGSISFAPAKTDEAYPRFFGLRGLFSAYGRLRPWLEIGSFTASFLIGFLFLGLFPRIFEQTAARLEKNPAGCFGRGLLAVLFLAVLVGLFAVTLIGLPISLLLALLGIFLWTAAKYLIAFFLGRKILLGRFGERRGWALFTGLLLLYLAGLIPYLGTLLRAGLILLSLGAVVQIRPSQISANKKLRSLQG